MNEPTPKEVQILEVVYDAFGGACLERQLLAFSDVSHDNIDKLARKNFLKRYEVEGLRFLIVRHAFYKYIGNPNRNFTLTGYNLKKSALLAEYWLTKFPTVPLHCGLVLDGLKAGTMSQHRKAGWSDCLTRLHAQGFYSEGIVPKDDGKHGVRLVVYFPQSTNPATIAKRIKGFFDSESEFEDIGEIEPRLTVCVASKRARDAILRRIDGRYWWIMERLDFTTLTCPEGAGLIVSTRAERLTARLPFSYRTNQNLSYQSSHSKLVYPQCGHVTYPSELFPFSHGAVYSPPFKDCPQFEHIRPLFCLLLSNGLINSPSSR